MSIKIVEEQVNKFIETVEPAVLAIRGHWGVGKTYYWKKIIYRKAKNKKVGLKQYAYISLFGINSLDEIKLEMFTKLRNLETNEITQAIPLNARLRKFSNFFKKQVAPYMQGVSLPFVEVD